MRQKPKGKTLVEVFAEEEAQAKAENSTCKSGIYGANVRTMNERTMGKGEELEVLDRAIAQLGGDSYLGVWLRGVRDEVADMIRSDFVPNIAEISITRTKEYCRQVSNEAIAKGDEIRANAKVEAEAILAKASDRAAQIAREARSYKAHSAEQLRKALQILEG